MGATAMLMLHTCVSNVFLAAGTGVSLLRIGFRTHAMIEVQKVFSF